MVLKQEENINKKPYLSASHRVSTHICTSSNKIKFTELPATDIKNNVFGEGGVLLI